MRPSVPIAALVILTGCALSAPITDPAALTQCGPQPDQWRCEEAVRVYVAQFGFKDPGSVQTRNIRLTGPRQWNFINGPILGWEVTFEVNGKNSYGGYVGFKPTSVLIRADNAYHWRQVL